MCPEILDELTKGLLETIGEGLQRIVLYGSAARGTNTNESDVDIAILLRGGLRAEAEDKLSDFIVDMNLKHDKVFSVIDINYEQFQIWENIVPFYQNVNEGIVLWKAA